MKLFTAQGFLTDYGSKLLSSWLDERVNLLLKDEQTEADVRMLGCVLSKRVGDLVNKRLLEIKK